MLFGYIGWVDEERLTKGCMKKRWIGSKGDLYQKEGRLKELKTWWSRGAWVSKREKVELRTGVNRKLLCMRGD